MGDQMEVDTPTNVVQAGKSSVQALLHPLVLIDVADHVNRFRLQSTPKDTFTA
ncbi:hypothetical protein SARC_17049, partial [Sphaeroforma arctica JP610]